MEVKIKKFQAQRKSVVADKCRNYNGKIYQHMIKLVYLDENNDHWITEITNYLSAVDVKTKAGSFDYEWYFDNYSDIDNYRLEHMMIGVFKKENSDLQYEVTDLNLDRVILSMQELKRLLVQSHSELRYSRLLDRSEIQKCINKAIQSMHLMLD